MFDRNIHYIGKRVGFAMVRGRYGFAERRSSNYRLLCSSSSAPLRMISPLKGMAEQKEKKKSRVMIWDLQWIFSDNGEMYARRQ